MIIQKIKIANNPDGTFCYATFDTYCEAKGKDYGVRVKHYIYRDKESRAYWHERRYLTRYKSIRPKSRYNLYISERVFFGKVRYVKYRDCCLPETWDTIAQTIRYAETHTIKK